MQDLCRCVDGFMDTATYSAARKLRLEEIGAKNLTPEERASYWSYLDYDPEFDLVRKNDKSFRALDYSFKEVSALQKAKDLMRQFPRGWGDDAAAILCTAREIIGELIEYIEKAKKGEK